MRVGIIALLHESNTFVSRPTTIERFREDLLLTGSDACEHFARTHHEVGGFIAGLEKATIEPVGILAARAVPFGTISAKAFGWLMETIQGELDSAGSLDGLLVAPHGATVSENHRDADGYWLRLLRDAVGDELPVIGTIDAHANLSQAMVDATDALVAYRSNPHLDQRERGLEAASLLVRTLRGDIRPVQSAVFPPMAINIECQHTEVAPCRPFYELADSQLEQAALLSNSILLGFPYADVEEMGASVLVVTDNDAPLAERLARELADHLWSNRHDFDCKQTGIEAAIDQASKLDGPICLLDMGDNVGGGSPGDGTSLAHAIHDRRLPAAFVCICDPEAASQAEEAGAGAQMSLCMGAKTDNLHGEPLEAQVTVLSIHSGQFEEPEPRHGGFKKMDQGRTAVVRTVNGLTIMLNSRRTPPFSLRQLTSCGLDPSTFELLVAKGVVAPLGAYAEVSKDFIRVNTPGVTSADMKSLEYQYRRRPMFPFEDQSSHPAPRDAAPNDRTCEP